MERFNLNLFLRSSTFGFLAIALITGVLYGCDNSIQSGINSASNEAAPPTLQDSIGYYYNYFLDQDRNNHSGAPEDFQTIADRMIDTAENEGHLTAENKDVLSTALEEVGEIFEENGFFEREPPESIFNSLYNDLSTRGYISTSLADDLVAIQSRFSEEDNLDDVLQFAHNRLDGQYAGEENFAVDAYLQTLEASMEYWPTPEEAPGLQEEWICDYGHYGYDAAGGIAGGLAGGLIGAAIGGAAASAFHDYAWGC